MANIPLPRRSAGSGRIWEVKALLVYMALSGVIMAGALFAGALTAGG